MTQNNHLDCYYEINIILFKWQSSKIAYIRLNRYDRTSIIIQLKFEEIC